MTNKRLKNRKRRTIGAGSRDADRKVQAVDPGLKV
jgi:hypothetical protein